MSDVTLNDSNPYLSRIFKVSNTNEPLAIAVYSGPTYYRESADTDLRIAILNSNKVLFEKVFTNTFYSNVQFNKTGLYTFTVNRISNDNDITLSTLIGHFSPDSYFHDYISVY